MVPMPFLMMLGVCALVYVIAEAIDDSAKCRDRNRAQAELSRRILRALDERRGK